MITQALAERAVNIALSNGGDFAELFLEDTESNSVSLLDSSPDEAASSRRRGCGVRVLQGNRCIYTHTAGLSEGDIIAAAQAAADAVQDEAEAKCQAFKKINYTSYAKKDPSDIDNAYRVKILSEASYAAKSADSRIAQVKASIADTDQRVLICNSEGLFVSDRRVRTRIRVQAVAADENSTQTGAVSPGAGGGYELFDKLSPEELGKQASASALLMLTAPECPSGVFPVVIGPAFGGVIFHEACGHSLETSSVARGNSEFCGKMGMQIAAPCVTAIDDGTLEGEWGSSNIDDEGMLTQRNVLIEKGILKSYLSDIAGARRMGIARTGSGRRQNYTYAPTSRMTNTFIAPGNDSFDEMISSMGEGLYAVNMGGGSVDPLTGEFNFAVAEGYWVKNGKLYCPVRGASLIGKGSRVLMLIDRVGGDLKHAAGMCGSSSGNVPTNVGQPHIRVSSITVGGKGEKL